MGSITAVKSLLEKGNLSQDCVLLVDEIYLQKGTQFHGGEHIAANENDELYKGIMVFTITGLKNSTDSTTCPEVTGNGEWLSQEILKCFFSTDEFWIFY